jgi:hypothetical protein
LGGRWGNLGTPQVRSCRSVKVCGSQRSIFDNVLVCRAQRPAGHDPA